MPAKQPALSIASVQFCFAGNPAVIPLRDPVTLAYRGETPEWTSSGARHPAAFVGGSRPGVRVVFRQGSGLDASGGTWSIGARGANGHGLVERTVRLEFGAGGLSQPVDFRFERPVPRGIGAVRRHWTWFAERAGVRHALGVTRHHVYHTWRRPVRSTSWAIPSERTPGPFGRPDLPWVYQPLMHWTCRWAAGRSSEKSICDEIIVNVRRSGLRYAVGAWNVGQMLTAGGGYCGGWFRMFQAMAGVHGVRVRRRAFLVDWRMEHRDIMRWCAIVVSAPGLGRRKPAEAASLFHDSNFGRFKRDPIQRFRVHRYRFWGHPGSKADGHCINFLQHRGRWYLYDTCFFDRPIALRHFTIPRTSATRTIAVEHMGGFQRAYLNHAVGHMLGSLRHAGKLYKTEHPDPQQPQFTSADIRNGLSVRTSIIPGRWRNITFYWMA